MPIINNTIYIAKKFVRKVDFLNVLNKTKPKGHEETFKGDRYIYYFDCVDGFTGIYVYAQIHKSVHIKYVWHFVYQLHLNMAVKIN